MKEREREQLLEVVEVLAWDAEGRLEPKGAEKMTLLGR